MGIFYLTRRQVKLRDVFFIDKFQLSYYESILVLLGTLLDLLALSTLSPLPL